MLTLIYISLGLSFLFFIIYLIHLTLWYKYVLGRDNAFMEAFRDVSPITAVAMVPALNIIGLIVILYEVFTSAGFIHMMYKKRKRHSR